MSKFATMLALMLATGYSAYCLITFPNTDVHFTYSAYISGAIAVILVFTELVRLILRGGFDGLEYMRQRRMARRNAKANAVLQDSLTRNVPPEYTAQAHSPAVAQSEPPTI